MKLKGIRFLYISCLAYPFNGGAELELHDFVTRLQSEGADVEVVTWMPLLDSDDSHLPYKIHRLISEEDAQTFATDEWISNSQVFMQRNFNKLIAFLDNDDWDVVIHFGITGPSSFDYNLHRVFKDKWINIGRIWDLPPQLNNGWEDWPWSFKYQLLLLPTKYHIDATSTHNSEPKMLLPVAAVNSTKNVSIDEEEWNSRPYDFGFVNPISHKGIGLVLNLISLNPDKKFIIKRGNYQDQTITEHLDKWFPNVTVAGWYENMDDFYQECKAILYPSLQEGFGMIPHEAMSNGCLCFVNQLPIVESAVGVGPIYIDAHPPMSKQNYFMYRDRYTNDEFNKHFQDAAEEWDWVIKEVMEDPQRVQEIRQKGLEALPRLHQHIEESYDNFYNYIVANLYKGDGTNLI